MLASSIARFQSEHGISLSVTTDNPLGALPFDTHVEMFEESLVKILINGWESYGDKPPAERPLWVRTALIEKPEGRVIEITVEDDGSGIPENLRDSIFEPFVSSKHTVGVGMGLTVARHSLRNLGGEVLVCPRIGGGTVVALTHPTERKTRKNTFA
jgi:C4-dicarboxylate-specific signal transduction histidine kinase